MRKLRTLVRADDAHKGLDFVRTVRTIGAMLEPREIVARFGGLRSMARALKLPPSTVMSWVSRKNIPARHIPALIETARQNEIELGVHDFFDLPEIQRAS